MKITYLGTTMLLLDDGTDQILFDCHVTRPSLWKCAFGKLKTDPLVCERVFRDFEPNRVRAVFLSHSHHDHCLDLPYFANRTGALVFGSESSLNVARGGDVAEDKLQRYVPDTEISIGKFSVRVMKSLHSKPFLFNNNLGQTIDHPLTQPAAMKEFKEGGSFEFLITHSKKTILIRPSYNFIPGALKGVHADILYLGISGLAKDHADTRKRFFSETIGRVKPEIVIPIHWDNFFLPLYGPVRGLPKVGDDTGRSLAILSEYCRRHGVDFLLQLPRSSTEF